MILSVALSFSIRIPLWERELRALHHLGPSYSGQGRGGRALWNGMGLLQEVLFLYLLLTLLCTSPGSRQLPSLQSALSSSPILPLGPGQQHEVGCRSPGASICSILWLVVMAGWRHKHPEPASHLQFFSRICFQHICLTWIRQSGQGLCGGRRRSTSGPSLGPSCLPNWFVFPTQPSKSFAAI